MTEYKEDHTMKIHVKMSAIDLLFGVSDFISSFIIFKRYQKFPNNFSY
jgi:hypothetical protein